MRENFHRMMASILRFHGGLSGDVDKGPWKVDLDVGPKIRVMISNVAHMFHLLNPNAVYKRFMYK